MNGSSPNYGKITLEANAVCEGERKRLGEAQDRMAEKETIPDIDVDLIDTVDPRTKEIWECCESLYWGRSTQMPVLRPNPESHPHPSTTWRAS